MIRQLGASVAVAVLLATSACGASSQSTRPSEADLSAGLQKGFKNGSQSVSLNKKQADCAAKVFVNSKISDEALKAIADRDQGYKPSKKDTDALTKVTPALAKCR